jgi:CHAD domain-containing protein
MKRKAEKAYFNELWGQMTAYLDDFLKTGDQEKLHHFRVQVKKLRALLEMLDTASPKNKLSRGFKPVRRIFKHAGIIREAYIHLQLCSHYGLKNDEFILSQVNEMEKGINEFKDNAKKYLKIIKAVHRKLEADMKAIDNDLVYEFYKSQLEQITAGLAVHRFDARLHNCRKRIKTLMYNRKIAVQALEDKLNVNSDYLDKFQGRIGDWHDTELAMALFSAQEAPDKLVIAKIKKQNTSLKKSINALAVDFWKKATLADEPSDSGQETKVWV